MMEEIQRNQWRNYLRRDMQNALIAFSSSSKAITVKAANQFIACVCNLTHNHKIESKNNLCVYLKIKSFHFQGQGV